MASKPRSAWSAAYAARIARAEQRAREAGVAFRKQLARGHKAGEHIIRKQKAAARKAAAAAPLPPPAAPPKAPTKAELKAEALGQLSPKDRAKVRKLGRELARRSLGPDGDADDFKAAADEAVAYATRVGMARFMAEVGHQRALVREYKAGRDDGTFIGGSYAGLIERWSREGGFADVKWYFYH